MLSIKYFPIFLILSTLTASQAFGQKNKMYYREPKVLLDFGFSANAYKGDLNNSYSKWNGFVHLGVKLNRKKRLNSQFEVSFGNLKGQNIFLNGNENNTQKANRFFSTDIFSLNYNLYINIIKKENFSVYLSQGVGFMKFLPKDEEGNDLIQEIETRAQNEDYNTNAFQLPSNLGVIYIFKPGFGLGYQMGLVNPLTDYLDNISQLGENSGNDNIFRVKFSFYAPISFEDNNKRR
ncbi:MAG: hypothetical protein KTR26_19340 [Flammeovirgaceae bacterium]|nr:hypothetical protein [Flammeovirgaceae bacterium]